MVTNNREQKFWGLIPTTLPKVDSASHLPDGVDKMGSKSYEGGAPCVVVI